MSAPELGKTYRIRNLHTGQYVSPHFLEIDEGKDRDLLRAVMWNKREQPRQAWHVFPQDSSRSLIVNATGGEILSQVTWSVEGLPSVVGARLRQKEDRYLEERQSWYLRESSLNNGTFYVISGTGKYLCPSSRKPGRTDGGPGWAGVSVGTGDQGDKIFMWEFEEADTVPCVKPLRKATDVLPVSPSMKDRNDPGDTAPELISRSVVPFLLVDEWGDGSSKQERSAFYRRAGTTPYYTIERFGYWKRLNYEAYDSPKEFDKEVELKYGVVTENSKQVETTTGIEVNLDLGCSFKGFSASVSTKLRYELHVTESHSQKTESWKTERTRVKYPAGKNFAGTTWIRADKYVVKRVEASGQNPEIISWETVNKNLRVISSWPPSKPTGPADEAPSMDAGPIGGEAASVNLQP